MKKIISGLMIYLMLFASVSVAAHPFSDVNGHWAEEYISRAYENGTVQGDERGFRPDTSISRAEFLKMVSACVSSNTGIEITDDMATESHWVSKYYNYAMQNFLLQDEKSTINSVSPGVFSDENADNNIQRWEMAVMLESVASTYFRDEMLDFEGFKDSEDIVQALSGHEMVTNCINDAAALGFLKGDENGNFNATENGTRAEAVVVVDRLDAYMKVKIADSLEKLDKQNADELKNVKTYTDIPTGHPQIEFVMENGDKFTVELYPEYAPQTCANFVSLVKDGFYDGLTFHRVIKDFMIQGGDPSGTGMSGSDDKIKGEFLANGYEGNTLLHQKGVISMARSATFNSATSQFFICYGDLPSLDGNYAAFGKVIKGMENVDKFADEKVTASLNGEMSKPVNTIVIKNVKLVK